MTLLKGIFVFIFLFSTHVAFSEALMSFQFSGESEKIEISEAREEVIENAIEKTSLKLIQKFIGEKEVLAHRHLIDRRVLAKHKKLCFPNKS